MGKYHGAVITTAGQNVIAQAISGTELTWTVMRTSSTVIPASTNLETLTSLSGIEQKSKITDATIYGDNVLQVSARFSNTGISTAYYIQAVGIYGQLAGGSETLIAVMTAVTPDEMPVYDPDSPSAFIFNTQITVQNADAVTMTVNDTGTATVADLNRKVDINGGDVSDTVVNTVTTSTAEYPVPSAGDSVKTIIGKITKFCTDIVKTFTGATSSAIGKKGLVPAPSAGQQTAYMRGDGTWVQPQNNATTTQNGYVLDAKMGKTLQDQITSYSDGELITNVNNAPLGFSCIGQNGTNSPFPNFWCTILTMRGNHDNSYTQQIAFPWSWLSSTKIAYRVYDNNSWYNWSYLDDFYKEFSLTLASGLSWNGYQTLQINGHVATMHINFWSKSALNAGTKITTLPSGYTYAFSSHYAVPVSGSTGTVCILNVSSSGEVKIETALAANAHVDVLMIGRAV